MPPKSKELICLEIESTNQKEQRVIEYKQFRIDMAYANKDKDAYLALTKEYPAKKANRNYFSIDEAEEEIEELEKEIEDSENMNYRTFQRKLSRISSLKKKIQKAAEEEKYEEDLAKAFKEEEDNLVFSNDTDLNNYHILVRSFHNLDLEEYLNADEKLDYLSFWDDSGSGDLGQLLWFRFAPPPFKVGHYLLKYEDFELYLYWRTKIRHKIRIKTPTIFAELYVYELINYIEYESVEETVLALRAFLETYRPDSKFIHYSSREFFARNASQQHRDNP